MVPGDNERRTDGCSEHVLNYRTDPEPIGAVAVGGAQHDQIWLSGASVQQNDPSCFSLLDINSDVHSSSLRRSAQVQQIRARFLPQLRPPLLIANTLPAINIASKQRSGATQAESAQIVI